MNLFIFIIFILVEILLYIIKLAYNKYKIKEYYKYKFIKICLCLNKKEIIIGVNGNYRYEKIDIKLFTEEYPKYDFVWNYNIFIE